MKHDLNAANNMIAKTTDATTSADLDALIRVLGLYFDTERLPDEDLLAFFTRTVDAACRFRATRS